MIRRFWPLIALTLALVVALAVMPSAAQDDAPTPTPSPAPQSAYAPPTERPPAALSFSDEASGVRVELLRDRFQQGRAGVMRLVGPGLSGGTLRVFGQESTFFSGPDDDFYAVFAVNMDQTARRAYPFTVQARFEDGSSATITGDVPVVLGNFILQDDLIVPAERAYLINPQVERAEFARLDSIFAEYTPEKLWQDAGFMLPINAQTTSPFGAFRVFNGTTETRHTGWDIRAATGTPVQAMGGGRVAFAGLMDIRGNHVIIDHGYGLFSGYSHLSQVHVTQGQTVQRGQIIGVSGNTGRSSGPHLHWEIAVNGEWVDSLDFLTMWLP